MIRGGDQAANVTDMHENNGEFKEGCVTRLTRLDGKRWKRFLRMRFRVKTKSRQKGLPKRCHIYSIGFTMKLKILFSVVAAGTLAFNSMALAAGTKTYQVTGPVLEMNDNMIAVQKGKDRWEIARDSSTKVNGDLKVGAKVTITYTMTATDVEVKAAKASTKKP